jgi:hypothetical protein
VSRNPLRTCPLNPVQRQSDVQIIELHLAVSLKLKQNTMQTLCRHCVDSNCENEFALILKGDIVYIFCGSYSKYRQLKERQYYMCILDGNFNNTEYIYVGELSTLISQRRVALTFNLKKQEMTQESVLKNKYPQVLTLKKSTYRVE